jgi:hypothetical protein
MLTQVRHLYKFGAIELDCELDFEPAQAGTEIDPPWPAAAYLMSATVGGVNILPLLSEGLIQDIEEDAAWAQS